MKKLIAISLLLTLVLSLAGCNSHIPQGDPGTKLASFPTDSNYPVKLVKTDSYWVSLVGRYGSSSSSISVSDTAQDLHTVYSAEDVTVWFMDADDEYVIWSELSEEFYTYKVHSIAAGTTETIFQTTANDVMQLRNVSLHNGFAYYAYMDYSAQQAHVFRYDLQKKSAEPIFSPKWEGDKSVMSFAVQDGLLSIAVPEGITVLDLNSGETVYKNLLPTDIHYVFSVSYDAVNKTCALYYADSDSEDIGIMKQGDATIRSIYTFGSNQYAYQDQIQCLNGRIYWISQFNASGNVTEHYSLVEYDYLSDLPNETQRTLNFYVDEHGEYLLRFDRSGEFHNIDLYQR